MMEMPGLSPDHVKLGNRIRDLRKSNDMTQEYVAAKVDIDRSHMGFIERGERNAGVGLIFRLAKLFRVKPSEFFK